VEQAFFDNKYSQYVLPLKLSPSQKTATFYVVLGNTEVNVPVLKAKNGIIPSIQVWEYLNIKELQNYFKTNNPIIIDIDTISNEGIKYFKNALNCVLGTCLIGLNTSRELSVNTELLYESIVKNKPLNNKLYIGYPVTLILYD